MSTRPPVRVITCIIDFKLNVIMCDNVPGAAGGGAGAEGNKSVMFSDGIRPGGDLTELDGRPEGHRWKEINTGETEHQTKHFVSELWGEDLEEEAEGGEDEASLEVRPV